MVLAGGALFMLSNSFVVVVFLCVWSPITSQFSETGVFIFGNKQYHSWFSMMWVLIRILIRFVIDRFAIRHVRLLKDIFLSFTLHNFFLFCKNTLAISLALVIVSFPSVVRFACESWHCRGYSLCLVGIFNVYESRGLDCCT